MLRSNGDREWYDDGQRHRVDGPAVELSDGYRAWWVNGKRHRIGGPAVEYANGYRSWWVNDKRHRVDGPAIECADGSVRWFIENIEYTEDAHRKRVQEIRRLEFEYFHRWYAKTSDLNTASGRRRMEVECERFIESLN